MLCATVRFGQQQTFINPMVLQEEERAVRIILLFIVMMCAGAASAQSAYEMKGIVLLQPESVIRERISASAIAPYVRSVNAAAADIFGTQKRRPAGGFLVLAVRPGKQSAVWLDIRPALSPALARELVTRLRAVAAPDVANGPVVFAIKVSLWGGTAPEHQMPTPSEWTDAAQKVSTPLEVGQLVESIWPR